MKIVIYNKTFFVFVERKLIFFQPYLVCQNSKLSNSLYTYFNVVLNLYKFGLSRK